MNSPPLVIDLDGTLIHSDMLHESALLLLRDKPIHLPKLALWLGRGKAVMKQRLAEMVAPNASALPYNEALLNWLKEERATGRTLVLCTASDQKVADAIANHLGIFDEVIASNGQTNLAGPNKASLLSDRFGAQGFDYAGNSHEDLAVWAVARKTILVNASPRVKRMAELLGTVDRVFERIATPLPIWGRMLRTHQWLKNLLLFVPLLAAHEWGSGEAWWSLILAFFSFSLCASSVYIANDLLDLESDRLHPRKRLRPFASGNLPVWSGVVCIPLLLIASLVIGSQVGGSFLAWLGLYFTITCAYSWALKRVVLVDCLTLALLYTLRVVAGAAAIGLHVSFWLLAFSVFLFLSLAFVKRYAELEVQRLSGRQKLHGRGYHTDDGSLVQTMGVSSGYAAVMVLALYLKSDEVVELYKSPEIIWGAVPVVLFWVSWMWMQAHRGLMHDDPLVYAVKDRASLVAGLLFALILTAGSLGIS